MESPDTDSEFEEIRRQYLDNRRRELPVLAAALQGLEFSALAKAGHNLKGTGAGYGFGGLTELGRTLESAAKASDGPAVAALLIEIESYLAAAAGPDQREQ